MAETEPRIPKPSVGMPESLYLDEFGSQVYAAFGHFPYHVGSSLYAKGWRDVDVRLILPDDEYAALGLGDPTREHREPKWVALVLAFSALAKQMTGLPVDFQIQQQTRANEAFGVGHGRSALGIVPLRYQQWNRSDDAKGSAGVSGDGRGETP